MAKNLYTNSKVMIPTSHTVYMVPTFNLMFSKLWVHTYCT